MTKKKPGAVRGRPSLTAPKVHSPKVGVVIPPDVLEEIDELKGQIGADRSSVIRALIEIGLVTVRRREAREKSRKNK